MEIPFDGILTLLIFLVGIPALVLQLISPAERRAAMKENRLDVQYFLKRALFIILIGLTLEFGVVILFNQLETLVGIDVSDDNRLLIEQAIWLGVFGFLFWLAILVAKSIPEQYGRRERIVEKLTHDVNQIINSSGRVGGSAFADLANLGKQCDPGHERQMVVEALMEITKTMLVDQKYEGDSFEALIDELVHMLASDPESKDLANYDKAIKILGAILATSAARMDNDRQRAIHAISKLGQTLIINFKSVERDNIILAYIDSLELALPKSEMLTEVSQALFELGSCAVREKHDFVFVAALDKMTTLAGGYSPLPDEFATDLLGLLAHYWTQDGSRKQLARDKFGEVRKFLKSPIVTTIEKSRSHLISTMYFDEADKLAQMAEDLRQDETKRIKDLTQTHKKK
ncbi:MAG: hypothetical protein J0M11_03315 [Anaerolineae bacterium]|nr:hypothetical protein [Anaerolineae bacterium]